METSRPELQRDHEDARRYSKKTVFFRDRSSLIGLLTFSRYLLVKIFFRETFGQRAFVSNLLNRITVNDCIFFERDDNLRGWTPKVARNLCEKS